MKSSLFLILICTSLPFLSCHIRKVSKQHYYVANGDSIYLFSQQHIFYPYISDLGHNERLIIQYPLKYNKLPQKISKLDTGLHIEYHFLSTWIWGLDSVQIDGSIKILKADKNQIKLKPNLIVRDLSQRTVVNQIFRRYKKAMTFQNAERLLCGKWRLKATYHDETWEKIEKKESRKVQIIKKDSTFLWEEQVYIINLESFKKEITKSSCPRVSLFEWTNNQLYIKIRSIDDPETDYRVIKLNKQQLETVTIDYKYREKWGRIKN